jgi:hypothetical protein
MNMPRETGQWVKALVAAFMISLGAMGLVRADSVVGPGREHASSVSPTSDITEDPSPIITVWKRLQTRIPFAASTDLTEDPSPIGSVWKKLRGGPRPTVDAIVEDPTPVSDSWKKLRPDTHPTVDVLTEDPTPTNMSWKQIHSSGPFQIDISSTTTSDPIEVMYVFYFIENDPAPILLIAEPN